MRCPLLYGVCDQGVLIGMCPNRPTCSMLRQLAELEHRLNWENVKPKPEYL
jgi:hypothetical protein